MCMGRHMMSSSCGVGCNESQVALTSCSGRQLTQPCLCLGTVSVILISQTGLGGFKGVHMQWDVKKEAALSRIVEQRMSKEAVEAENAANNAKLAEHLVHVSALSPLNEILSG